MKKRVWIVLLTAGVLLMGIGALRNEHWVILQKAIRVCLECIGIG